METITKEAILSLNDGSVTFEQARAQFNVDLYDFKERLAQLNIFTWNEVDGSLVRIHGGDYELKLLFRGLSRCFVVKGTTSFEDVIHMLENRLNLSPGCYKLTYKHPNRSKGLVWVKTDRDWHFAVLISVMRGYFVLLNLEVFPSSQTADEDACDEDACDEDASDEDDACDDDATDDEFYTDDFEEDDFLEDVYVEDASEELSQNPMPIPITKEAILSLNNGSVTFEEARARFNVDLSAFKATLEQLNIFTWKEPNGSLVRIHGGNYEITIVLKNMQNYTTTVKGTKSFEDVIRILEKRLNLTPGCYKLTYKHPVTSMGYVLLETDRDWHLAVSKMRGYYVFMNLEVFPSRQTDA